MSLEAELGLRDRLAQLSGVKLLRGTKLSAELERLQRQLDAPLDLVPEHEPQHADHEREAVQVVVVEHHRVRRLAARPGVGVGVGEHVGGRGCHAGSLPRPCPDRPARRESGLLRRHPMRCVLVAAALLRWSLRPGIGDPDRHGPAPAAGVAARTGTAVTLRAQSRQAARQQRDLAV